MLQILGVLELRSQQLRCHAFKMINVTICGTATTEFWRLMESYFRVDEDADEGALEDAQSLADILAQKRAWASENVPSITKESSKETGEAPSTSKQQIISPEVVHNDDEEGGSVASAPSTLSGASGGSLKTLATEKESQPQEISKPVQFKGGHFILPNKFHHSTHDRSQPRTYYRQETDWS